MSSSIHLDCDFLKKIRYPIGKKKWTIWDEREKLKTRSFLKKNAKSSTIKFLHKISGSDKRASWSYYQCIRLTYNSNMRHSSKWFRRLSSRSNWKKLMKKSNQFWKQKWQTVRMMSSSPSSTPIHKTKSFHGQLKSETRGLLSARMKGRS